jgi:hypothetical protein
MALKKGRGRICSYIFDVLHRHYMRYTNERLEDGHELGFDVVACISRTVLACDRERPICHA